MINLKRILYVEDEKDIQSVAEIALEVVGGFELLICSSGQEALEMVQDFSPQLLLLDVMMPDMDGPETLRQIRSINSQKYVPAVFMTAKVQPAEVSELKSIGAIDVIAKPFDPMTLSETINSIWSRYSEVQA